MAQAAGASKVRVWPFGALIHEIRFWNISAFMQKSNPTNLEIHSPNDNIFGHAPCRRQNRTFPSNPHPMQLMRATSPESSRLVCSDIHFLSRLHYTLTPHTHTVKVLLNELGTKNFLACSSHRRQTIPLMTTSITICSQFLISGSNRVIDR